MPNSATKPDHGPERERAAGERDRRHAADQRARQRQQHQQHVPRSDRRPAPATARSARRPRPNAAAARARPQPAPRPLRRSAGNTPGGSCTLAAIAWRAASAKPGLVGARGRGHHDLAAQPVLVIDRGCAPSPCRDFRDRRQRRQRAVASAQQQRADAPADRRRRPRCAPTTGTLRSAWLSSAATVP